MNGKKLLIGLSYIDRKYIEESEQDMPVRNAITTTINQNKAQLKCLSTKKIWLIAAVIALTLLLVGFLNPSNTIRQQAEQSGLSVIYPQDQIQEDGLSATDQGITVSVKQTIVDQWRASIVLKIEGFELPDGVRPCFYGERPTLDGNAEFCGSAGYHFYDGIVTNESGESVYKNGEPVKEEQVVALLDVYGSDNFFIGIVCVSFAHRRAAPDRQRGHRGRRFHSRGAVSA